MTTDKKQPPDTDRPRTLVFSEVSGDGGAKTENRGMILSDSGQMWFVGSGERVEAINAEGFRVFRRDDSASAILDRYDEERAEWEAKVIALETGINSALEQVRIARSQVTALTEERDQVWKVLERTETEKSEECARADKAENELDEALARADRAEKERDEALEWRRKVADALDCIKDNGEIGDVDYVTKYARSVRHVADQRHDAIAERDRAIAERDDLGCQLEALRAIQRNDVADLRTRMEAVERWRAECELADQSVQVCIANAEAEEARLRRDDEKGGA